MKEWKWVLIGHHDNVEKTVEEAEKAGESNIRRCWERRNRIRHKSLLVV